MERERDRDDVVDTAATLNFVNQPLSNEILWILNVRLNEARRKMCIHGAGMLVSKMHRKGKCPSSEERDPFVSKEIFISLFLRWEPRNVERVWIRLRVKESRKISGSLFQIDREGSRLKLSRVEKKKRKEYPEVVCSDYVERVRLRVKHDHRVQKMECLKAARFIQERI